MGLVHGVVGGACLDGGVVGLVRLDLGIGVLFWMGCGEGGCLMKHCCYLDPACFFPKFQKRSE